MSTWIIVKSVMTYAFCNPSNGYIEKPVTDDEDDERQREQYA